MDVADKKVVPNVNVVNDPVRDLEIKNTNTHNIGVPPGHVNVTTVNTREVDPASEVELANFFEKVKPLEKKILGTTESVGKSISRSNSDDLSDYLKYGPPEIGSNPFKHIELELGQLYSQIDSTRKLIDAEKEKPYCKNSQHYTQVVDGYRNSIEKINKECHEKYGAFEKSKEKMLANVDPTYVDDYDDEDVRDETVEEKGLGKVIATNLAEYKVAVEGKDFAAAEISKSRLIDNYNRISEKYKKHAVQLGEYASSAKIAADKSGVPEDKQFWNLHYQRLTDASLGYYEKAKLAKIEADKLGKRTN
ncbi:MAG: hypothetical protein LBB18_00160 [Puniceicoccales bacterium]|jgi:hypothetical protein|nr:hypothetical protein [Puniceicoccales bacterium]